MMRASPTGTVTFLFTDIEGSTPLWEKYPEEMKAALARHDALLRHHIEDNHGFVFKTVGDAFDAAFSTVHDAVHAAIDIQRALPNEDWGTIPAIKVRIAMHTGVADESDGDYFGPTVNRAARIRDAGAGGQVLISTAAADLIRDGLPEDASLLDLGAVRMKGIEGHEVVYQLVHPELPSDFPPLKSLSEHPSSLPRQLTRFIGRRREMAEVARLLSGNRLVTLTGAGGCGKTRLAVEVGGQLLGDFTDGVWFADLAPLAAPELSGRAVGSALGLHFSHDDPAGDSTARRATAGLSRAQEVRKIVDYVQGKRLLLLLDNCEHMIEACASLAESLLKGCDGVKILATSRESLNIGGEVSWRVPSLSIPDAGGEHTVEALGACESVALFAERASAMLGDFRLTAENAGAVAQICRRLDGIPLAIELAAARIKALSAEQIAARLDSRFALLTGGSRTALRRQQTLHSLIDWSYELLSPKERLLLSRLSIFAGGWSLEAAESVCAGEGLEGEEVLDLLTRLVGKSLANVEEGEGEQRYRLLETIRQYAQEKLLASGEALAARARHRDWYLRLAEEAEAGFQGSGVVRWRGVVDLELDNIRAAIEWCFVEEGGVDKGLRIASALDVFWGNFGSMSEGLGHLHRLLEKSGGGASPARAKALAVAGVMESRCVGVESGTRLSTEALEVSRSLGDKRLIAAALSSLADAERMRGNRDRSRQLFEESLSLWRQTGHIYSLSGNS